MVSHRVSKCYKIKTHCFADYLATNNTIDVTIPTRSVFQAVPLTSVFGWIIIQQNLDNGHDDFLLPWHNYKFGFGSIDADWWLGLENMHLITSLQPYRLRVEVQERSTNLWYSAEYWSFKIGDELNDKYRLEVSGYSGDAGDALQHVGDFMGDLGFGIYLHNGMMFSTYDQDNDNYANYDCASSAHYHGGWWFNGCYYACLTCNFDNHGWRSLPGYFLVTSRMMIKPQ